MSLRPAFTILHTLPIPRAPSPIVTLAWHASSTKQKSDMLAIQTADGDLRVWSVAKPPTAEPPRVIRVLKRLDTVESGPNWIAWSKNGRIIQYAEGYVTSNLRAPCIADSVLLDVGRHGPGTSGRNMYLANRSQLSQASGAWRIMVQLQLCSL